MASDSITPSLAVEQAGNASKEVTSPRQPEFRAERGKHRTSSKLLLNTFAGDLPGAPPCMAYRCEPCLDLLFAKVSATLAFGQTCERQRQREQVEKLAVAPLNVGGLARLISGHQ